MTRGGKSGNARPDLKGTRVTHKVYPPHGSIYGPDVFSSQIGMPLRMTFAGQQIHTCKLISAVVEKDGSYATLELEIQ